MSVSSECKFRYAVDSDDLLRVQNVVAETGFFSPAETEIAVELVAERLTKGPSSGYEFVIAESAGEFAGYACYGEIACSVGSYDLYWIVVSPRMQGQGIGRLLLDQTERQIQTVNGRHLYADTSGRDQYASTRGFYEKNGFQQAALLEDFYAPGDAKVIYRKILNR